MLTGIGRSACAKQDDGEEMALWRCVYSHVIRHHSTLMRFDEFIIAFKDNVYALAFERQIDLAVFVCKRLFPDYVAFTNEHHWGNFDLLLDGIGLVEHARNGTVNQPEVERLLQEVEMNIPDSDDFGDASGSFGQNASAAVGELLQFLLDRDAEHIYNIGTYLTDTVDLKVHELGCQTEEEIDSHPLMLEARQTLIDLSANGA
jgi:uncharacterized protein YjaG (DUF416 family)